MKTHRRTVALLAGPALRTAREVYATVPSDTVRVAALVEIAAGAAALARTLVKLRHLDPDLIAPHVSHAEDLRAVLGRGRWLPTMTRTVPEPPEGTAPVMLPARSVRRRLHRRGAATGQEALFSLREVP